MKRKVIALTGKIGSGKSTVAKMLAEKGFKVIDCDALSRQVAEDSDALHQVEALLGAESTQGGKLNRKFVREKIFANKNLHARYSEIFWKKIKELLTAEVAACSGLVFVEIPVLDAFSFDWNEIWCVECSVGDSIRRVTKRDNVSQESVLKVLNLQSDCACTRKIFNNGTLADLQLAVENALSEQ